VSLSTYPITSTHGTSAGAWGGGSIEFNGEGLPPYWIWHQDGSPGGKIPKREFLGISIPAQEAIFAIFDAHVEGSLAGLKRSTGQPMIKGPGIRGAQFAPFFGRT
jgi:hypothetical protein